jgi:hypothetical protein
MRNNFPAKGREDQTAIVKEFGDRSNACRKDEGGSVALNPDPTSGMKDEPSQCEGGQRPRIWLIAPPDSAKVRTFSCAPWKRVRIFEEIVGVFQDAHFRKPCASSKGVRTFEPGRRPGPGAVDT